MTTRSMTRGFYASMMIGLGACAAATDSAAEDDEAVDAAPAEQRLLAELDIAGGKARFVATDPDSLWIMTDTVGVPTPLRDPAIRGLNAAETYEYWSGKQAPAALVEHALRVGHPDDALVNEAVGGEKSEGVAATTAALTAIDFANGFCNGMQYCWLDRGGTWEHEERARYWMGYVDTVRGSMTVQMRRRDAFGNWSSLWVYDLPEGHVFGAFSATSGVINQRYLKFKIFNADGDDWHLAATWNP